MRQTATINSDDELRSRLRLASKEAQRQWEVVEERLMELERGVENQGASVRGTASEVAVSVARVFRDFMLRHLPDSGPARAPVHDAMRTRVYIVAPEDTLARAAQVIAGEGLPEAAQAQRAATA